MYWKEIDGKRKSPLSYQLVATSFDIISISSSRVTVNCLRCAVSKIYYGVKESQNALLLNGGDVFQGKMPCYRQGTEL